MATRGGKPRFNSRNHLQRQTPSFAPLTRNIYSTQWQTCRHKKTARRRGLSRASGRSLVGPCGGAAVYCARLCSARFLTTHSTTPTSCA